MNREFSSSLDLTTKIITLAAVGLLFGAAAISVVLLSRTIQESSQVSGIVMGGSALLITSVLVGTWVFRVVGYAIIDESLIIRRPIGNRTFSISEIQDVIIPPTKTIRWSFRAFGNGGLFGFTGYFTNTTFGMMRWYATRINNHIVIVFNDERKVVITPDDMGMASAIREKAGLPPV
jgi:hypothetical protein